DRSDPADREQQGRNAAQDIEMGERIEREAAIVAWSRLAQCDRCGRGSEDRHSDDEQESAKAQHELLQRKIDQDGTGPSPPGRLCMAVRYFCRLIFCWISRSAGSSPAPGV